MGALASPAVLLPVLQVGCPYSGMAGWGGAGGTLAFGSMALFALGGLVVAAAVGFRATRPAGPGSPIELVKLRYARGEITPEVFERLRRDLS